LARKNHVSDRLDDGRLTKRVNVSIAVPSLRLLESLMDAKTVLDSFGVQNEVSIVAAHWAPKKLSGL
jgi:phosphoribosylcarboxyaminoimidazole (NCAIR) mutase